VNPVRVVVVDDQELVVTGLRALVAKDGDIAVVAVAGDGRQGVSAVRQHVPDVVLMDLRMPVLDGVAALREIRAEPRLDPVHVVVLTTFDDDADVLEALRAGASGFLLKDVAPEELRRAVRRASAGEHVVAPSVLGRLFSTFTDQVVPRRPELLQRLTEREVDVLRLVGVGLSNDEIGAELGLSPATARTYVSRLLAKLRAGDRARLVVLSYESGLVRPGEGRV